MLNLPKFSNTTEEFENLITHKNVNRGFCDLITLSIKSLENVQKCIIDLESIYDVNVYDFSTTDAPFFIVEAKSFCAYFRSNSLFENSVKIYAENTVILEQLFELCKPYEEIENLKETYLHAFYLMGPELTYRFSIYKPTEEIKKEYYPFLDVDKLIDAFLQSKETILFITGESGIGKSKFANLVIKRISEMKDVPEDEYCSLREVGYVNSPTVLSNDMFWSTIVETGIGLMIIDDLDAELNNRNSFCSKFLSFTDGLSTSKVKFIITTNQKYSDFDTALTRRGRLFDCLKFRALHENEAKKIWENATDEPYPFKGDVKQCDLDSELFVACKKIDKEYLKETPAENDHLGL